MRPVAHHPLLIPSVSVPRRTAGALATILVAAAAGVATIAVVSDGESGTATQSFSRPAPDVRYDGGPNEGVAVQSMRGSSAQPVRPVEGAAVQAMRGSSPSQPVRPVEGAAVQAMRSQSPSQVTFSGNRRDGAAALSLGSGGSVSSSPVRPEEGVAVRSIGR